MRIMLLGVVAVLRVGATVDAGGWVFSTIPAAEQCVRDGMTEYRLDVYLDTTDPDLNGKTVRQVRWDVYLPEAVIGPDYPPLPLLTFTRGELPSDENPSTNPNDFFYGVPTDPRYSVIHWTFENHFNENVRTTEDTCSGAPSRRGLLASYWFTVSPYAPLGETSFEVGDFCIVGGDGQLMDYGTIENQPFTIIPEPATLSVLALGGLALMRRRTR